MKRIGVIGAGQMGRGIAEVVVLANYDVVLIDINAKNLQNSQQIIQQNLSKSIERNKLSQSDVNAALARLQLSTDMASLSNVELCIEAVSETESIKKDVLKSSQQFLPEKALVASNTSSISITRLATAIKHPDRFIGLHFMNPVPKMKLVEVIRGLQTSPETFETACTFLEGLDKTIAVSEDFPAFIVNRILIPMINEAILTLYEGVGNVENIDKAMKLGANHPLGPLELADYIGLDTVLSILQVLYEGLADPKYRPCPLLNRYVEAGWLGKKTGRGFYDYSGDVPVPTR